MSLNRIRFVGAVLPLLLGAGFANAQDEAAAFEKALARYKECQDRIPFRFHVQGREALARTRTQAALNILAKDYGNTKEHPEHTRYTLASQFGRYFNTEEFVPTFAALRKKYNKPIDTWLWYQTLRNEVKAVGPEGAVAIAQTAKKAHQRAAAIAALGAAKDPEFKAAVMANVLEFPKKSSDRMLLLGAMTGAIWDNRKRINDDDYRNALKSYISLLEPDVKLDHTAKVQMARHLQKMFDAPAQFTNAQPWLQILERGEVKKKKDYGTSAKPSFFGIESEGERFCYVLDMSDSMLKEISPDARPKGPITGPKKKRKKKSMDVREGDLPWHRIETRWDLAREQLRISLARLPKEKFFSIVWYGTEADTLKATPGMVKATKGNIKKALAELDAIKATYNERLNRDALRGKTALHYGFQVAFGLGKRGVIEESAYVEAKPLTEGADTVFLLSDGAPNFDAYEATDVDYGEGKVVRDLENGVEAPRSAQLEYHGPYANFPQVRGNGSLRNVDCWLLRDIRRMNAFRRIKIHCVGLGEANETLLKCLAMLGDGEVFIVGKKKQK